MPQHQPPVTIEATESWRRDTVLPLLRLGPARTERLLAAAEFGKIDTRGLFHARRGERLVGAGWGQIVPGRTAFCWPPGIVPGEPEMTAFDLQQAVDAHLDSSEIAMTQAVLSMRDIASAKRLVRAGYVHLADLHYLLSSIENYPLEQPSSSLQFATVSAQDEARLAALLQRTYEQTLDCPDLSGVRCVEDVLTGYRQTGAYRRQWWQVARFRGEDVGCLLLADYPEYNQCELMYMGIAPPMRGRGWGFDLIRHAQWMMRNAGRKRIILAVDDSNWPARGIYERAGFETWDRRRIYFRTRGVRRG